MNIPRHQPPRIPRAFTLVELLIVIAVIAVLAALILPVGAKIKQAGMRSKARAELEQVALAIEAYKEKFGHYPPDSPTSPWLNQLYFELLGTTYTNLPPDPPKPGGPGFQTLDGSARIISADIPTTFGAGVSGFVNCTRAANADDAPQAKAILVQIKPGQYGETAPGSGIRLLACSVRWPENHAYQPIPAVPGLNPWRYVSSNPTNNASSFDLWVDLFVGGKTNRISNWNKQVQFVNSPF